MLCSTFAKTVFPEKAPLPKRNGAHKIAVNAARIMPVSQEIKWIAKDYTPRTRISHKSFGPGLLTDKKDGIVTVRFDDGKQKHFSLSAALQKELFLLL